MLNQLKLTMLQESNMLHPQEVYLQGTTDFQTFIAMQVLY